MISLLNRRAFVRWLVAANAVYYLFTGLWPLLDINSFMIVTGPKTDLWLVKMVGCLAASSGICMLYSALRKEFPPLLFLLGIVNSLSFISVDVIYVLNGTIRSIYLLDATAEAFLLCIYITLLRNTRTI